MKTVTWGAGAIQTNARLRQLMTLKARRHASLLAALETLNSQTPRCPWKTAGWYHDLGTNFEQLEVSNGKPVAFSTSADTVKGNIAERAARALRREFSGRIDIHADRYDIDNALRYYITAADKA